MNNSNQPTPNKDEEIKRAFYRLERIDKNALKNLQRLADMAERNPSKYFLALKFL